jgi:hypothetical protein
MPQCQGTHEETTEEKRDRTKHIYWNDQSCDCSPDHTSVETYTTN